ncbi:MAG: FAD:protein FMN transferase [Acidobacteriota bacterium]
MPDARRSVIGRLSAAVLATAAATALQAAGGSSAPVVARDVILMGTRARLATVDDNRARGLARLERALGVLEGVEAALSTWRPDSEISRLNSAPARALFALSPATCETFRALDRWTRDTGGAFDAATGALTSAWDLHGAGRVPGDDAVAAALAASGWARLGFDAPGCTVRRADGVQIDVGGFGKGAALDAVAAALADDATPWLIDLGGQVAARGARASGGWPVSLAHPLDRVRPAVAAVVRDDSLATSAGSERDLVVDGRRVGHILDPRTGRPAPFAGSVTVRHPQALAADILSTALFVMGPDAGLAWADAHGVAALYLESPSPAAALVARASRAWLAGR